MRILILAILASFAGPACAQGFNLGLEPAPASRYGAIPNAYSPLTGSALPQSLDLSADMPPPGKQANQSCVGWAVAYALKSYQERKERQWSLLRPDGQVDFRRVFSPAFIYNQINGGIDLGSNFGDAFHVLATQGAAPWSAMPYTGEPFAPVTAAAREAAAPYRIDTFRKLDHRNVAELKAQLVAGFPVVIGARVYQQLEQLAPGAVWSFAAGPSPGNHAMLVVGYDDAKQAFKIINSWGTEWSSNGYGWISYQLFTQVVNEAYIVADLTGTEAQIDSSSDVWTPPTIAAENSLIAVDPTQINLNYFEPSLGGAVGMRLAGTITIPPGVRGTAQVVIPLSLQANGQPVRSFAPAYMLPSGQAAFGTPAFQLDGSGVTNLPWYAFIPYCALDLPKTKLCIPMPTPSYIPPAQSDLVAEPVLFIDNFGVAGGQPVNFYVRL